MNLSRKEFLRRGVLSVGELLLKPLQPVDVPPAALPPLRPPGFVEALRDHCRTCELCVQACPSSCLKRLGGVDGPVFDPRSGVCTFCGGCSAVCPHGVLSAGADTGFQRPGIAVPDNGRCLAQRGGCFSCLEKCPEEALALEMGVGVSVDRERCTGCGACEYACPLDPAAIRLQSVPRLS